MRCSYFDGTNFMPFHLLQRVLPISQQMRIRENTAKIGSSEFAKDFKPLLNMSKLYTVQSKNSRMS